MGKSISELYDEMKGFKSSPGSGTGVTPPVAEAKPKLPIPDSIEHSNDPIVKMFLEQREGKKPPPEKKDDKKKKPPFNGNGDKTKDAKPTVGKETDDEQDKVKLGVKTPIDLEPSTDDISVSDVEGTTKTPKKNVFKKPLKTEGFLGTLGTVAKDSAAFTGGAVNATLAKGGISPRVGRAVLNIIKNKKTAFDQDKQKKLKTVEPKKVAAPDQLKHEPSDHDVNKAPSSGAPPPPSNPMAVKKKTKGAKPFQGKPPKTLLSKTSGSDLMGEIFSGFHAGPPKIKTDDWKGSYDAAIKHHNTGIDAHNSGDSAKARMHFRTRDKYLTRFARSAPIENVKKINMDKFKELQSIKERREINPQIKYGGPWRDSVNKISGMNLDIGTMQVKRLAATGKNRDHLEKEIKKAKGVRDKAIEVHRNTFPIKVNEGAMKDWLMSMEDDVHSLSAKHKGDKTKAKAEFLKKHPDQHRVFHDTWGTTSGDYPIPGWKPAKLRKEALSYIKGTAKNMVLNEVMEDMDEDELKENLRLLNKLAFFGFYPFGPMPGGPWDDEGDE